MLRALRLEVMQPPTESAGFEVADLGREGQFVIEHILQSLVALSAQEPVGKSANSERFAELAPIDDRVEFLRKSHQERFGHSQNEKVVAIGEAASRTNFTIAEILELEKNGLIVPQRTHGGQRRFSTFDLKRLADLHERLRLELKWDSPLVTPTPQAHSGSRRFSGNDLRRLAIPPQHPLATPPQRNASENDDPSASMRSTKSGQAPVQDKRAVADAINHRKKIKEVTMNTVAQLYLEACDRYPNRDKSVVEYINKNLEWLSEDDIITMVRLARRRGIYLPIYRRGRLPKTSGKPPDDIPSRTNPRIPDPIVEPDEIPEPVEPIRVPVKPKVPNRPKISVPTRPKLPVPETDPVPELKPIQNRNER